MDTVSYTEEIKGLYNECWASYKQYLSDHDMRQYNARQSKIIDKYECIEASNLLLFFSPIVNKLHAEYEKMMTYGE